MKVEKVYPAGWKMITPDDTYYFGEYGKFGCYCNDGVVYKDEEAFKTGQGVCYINEYGFENSSLLSECDAKEAIASEIESTNYVAIQGYTREDLVNLCAGDEVLAEELFNHLDWMAPETLIDEWEREEED